MIIYLRSWSWLYANILHFIKHTWYKNSISVTSFLTCSLKFLNTISRFFLKSITKNIGLYTSALRNMYALSMNLIIIHRTVLHKAHGCHGKFFLSFEGNTPGYHALLSKNPIYYEKSNNPRATERGEHQIQQAGVIAECGTLNWYVWKFMAVSAVSNISQKGLHMGSTF